MTLQGSTICEAKLLRWTLGHDANVHRDRSYGTYIYMIVLVARVCYGYQYVLDEGLMGMWLSCPG